MSFSCPAKLRASISTGDHAMPSHPCRIEFTGDHNHSLRSAAILREFRMSESTKKEFFTYFEQGVNNAKDKGVRISSVVVFKMYYSN